MSQNAHDMLSEQALIGAMIESPAVALASFLAVPAEAYYSIRHQVLAGVLRDMVAKRMPVDAVTVLGSVMELGILEKIGGAGYIHTCIAHCPTATNADWYAERLCELYARRSLTEALTREAQRLDAAWESGEVSGAADSVLRLRSVLDEVTAYSACAAGADVTYLDDFLAQETNYDWLVSGLMERRDRLILTGDEGFGKSELAAQLACCMAAGIHPFTGRPMIETNIRVAVVDCENSNNQTRRRYRRMVTAVNNQRALHQAGYLDWSKQLAIEFRTDGLNLLAGADIAWLERFVVATTPDVLVVGPLYKLHQEDMNNEPAARSLTVALDSIRARHGCAIITEAHAGHAKGEDGKRHMRPRGSSLFLGWPEFGLGLRRQTDNPEDWADVVAWRGHRDERMWPTTLFKARAGVLPWRPGEEYYDLEEPDWDAQ